MIKAPSKVRINSVGKIDHPSCPLRLGGGQVNGGVSSLDLTGMLVQSQKMISSFGSLEKPSVVKRMGDR
jgi:hypothetical protein